MKATSVEFDELKRSNILGTLNLTERGCVVLNTFPGDIGTKFDVTWSTIKIWTVADSTVYGTGGIDIDTLARRNERGDAANDGTNLLYVMRNVLVVLLIVQSIMTFSVQPGLLKGLTIPRRTVRCLLRGLLRGILVCLLPDVVALNELLIKNEKFAQDTPLRYKLSIINLI